MAGRYQAFDPVSEVIGQAMLGFIRCAKYGEIYPFLEKHGLTNIDPDRWYLVQTWLDVLSDLAEARPNQAMSDFVSVGMAIAEVAPMSPVYDDGMPFGDAMVASSGGGYLRGHRGGDVGGHSAKKIDDNHIIVTTRTPYPDDVVYGVLYGMARRYLPDDASFTVKYDTETLRRDHGGEVTIFHIAWQ
jgi:hypothetical protein